MHNNLEFLNKFYQFCNMIRYKCLLLIIFVSLTIGITYIMMDSGECCAQSTIADVKICCSSDQTFCCDTDKGCGDECPDNGCKCPQHANVQISSAAMITSVSELKNLNLACNYPTISFFFLLKKPSQVYLSGFVPPNIA
jgi:hypothetical protein